MKKFFNFKKISFIIFTVIFCSVIILPAAINASEYLPGNDPIVTLSYITDVLTPKIKTEVKEDVLSSIGGNTSSFTVVEMKKGQVLTSKDGVVEFILRPGSSATAVSSGENGLSDISNMSEILNGDSIGVNHEIIIPRNDNRGIKITSDTAFILVRGNYNIGD